jgi:hypothetical protein
VAADLGGERLEGLLELVDLRGERGQRERLAGRMAVLVDQLAQRTLAVEGGAADPRALCDLGEGDALPGALQLGTRLADSLQPRSRALGSGLVDQLLQPGDQAAVSLGLLAPAALLGVLGEQRGVVLLR